MAGSLHADEQSAQYSIVGLFSPDREKDLRQVLEDVPEIQLANLDFKDAQVTLRYDLNALFPEFNAKKPPTAAEIEERLNKLLGEASDRTFSLKPLSTVPKEKLEKLETQIGILDCKGCRYGAYLAATRVEGVVQAMVNTAPSTVTAWIDPAKTNRAAVEASLKKAKVEVKSKP